MTLSAANIRANISRNFNAFQTEADDFIAGFRRNARLLKIATEIVSTLLDGLYTKHPYNPAHPFLLYGTDVGGVRMLRERMFVKLGAQYGRGLLCSFFHSAGPYYDDVQELVLAFGAFAEASYGDCDDSDSDTDYESDSESIPNPN